MARWLVVAALATLFVPASAAADPGGITQLTGAAGCLTSTALPECGAARGLDQVEGLALSPDGDHAYAASLNGVTTFARDAGSGALTQLDGDAGCLSSNGATGCGAARGMPWPTSVAVSPDGAYVYVVTYQGAGPSYGSGLAVFARHPDSGTLTQLPGAAGCFGEDTDCVPFEHVLLTDIAVSADSKDVYLATLAGIVGFRRGTDGALTRLAAPGGCVAVQSAASGEGACQGARGFGTPQAIEFAPDGRLLVTGGQNSVEDPYGVTTFDRDPSTGSLSQPAGEAGCLVWDVDSHLGPGCATGIYLHGALALAIAPDGSGVHVSYGSGRSDGLGATGYGVMTAARSASGLLTERRPGSGFGDPPFDKIPALAIPPDARNLYGSRMRFAGSDFGEEGNGITAWARSGSLYAVQGPTGCVSETGTRGECADGRGLVQPRTVLVSPDGRFVYAASQDPGALTVFAREDPGAFNDVDRDGIPDDRDTCPTGSAGGCQDADNDGIQDYEDACPDAPGPAGGDGCPAGSGPGGSGGSALAQMKVKQRSRIAKLAKKRRLAFSVSCEAPVDFKARLRLPKKQARKLKVGRRLAARVSGSCAGPGTNAKGSFALKRKPLKRLRNAGKAKPVISGSYRDASGNISAFKIRLTWRR